MPAAAGRRSLRGTPGVAAGGSGERCGLGGANGWAQRTWPQAPVAGWKEAGERRKEEVDAILEFDEWRLGSPTTGKTGTKQRQTSSGGEWMEASECTLTR